jgi:hypothetical protein
MSIVTLKRNSRRFQVPISGGEKVFSLNGGHRNLRAFGNTNLAQLKKKAEFCYANDPTIVKLSTKNTKGYVYDNLWYPTCTVGGTSLPLANNDGSGERCMNPVQWVKNYSPLSSSQGIYILDKVVAATATGTGATFIDAEGNVRPCLGAPEIKNDTGFKGCGNGVKMNYWVGGRPICQNMYAKNGGFQGQGALISSIYTRTLLKKNNCLPTPVTAQAFPPAVLHNGCDVNYLTPQAAIAGGLLPPNWTGKA